MFISQAFAQTAATAAETASAAPAGHMIIQMALVVLIVYFILIRPQQKRLKRHEAELKAIIKGTRVVVGGIVGRVVALKGEDELVVELAPDVQVTVLRNYISQVFFETPLNQPAKSVKGK